MKINGKGLLAEYKSGKHVANKVQHGLWVAWEQVVEERGKAFLVDDLVCCALFLYE